VDLNADEFGFIIPRRGPAISFKLADPTGTGIVVGGINDLRQLVGYSAPKSTAVRHTDFTAALETCTASICQERLQHLRKE
jgi:hypothetical protein